MRVGLLVKGLLVVACERVGFLKGVTGGGVVESRFACEGVAGGGCERGLLVKRLVVVVYVRESRVACEGAVAVGGKAGGGVCEGVGLLVKGLLVMCVRE